MPSGERGKALIGQEIRPVERQGQLMEEFVLGAGDGDGAVGGGKELERDDRRVGGIGETLQTSAGRSRLELWWWLVACAAFQNPWLYKK